jgi:hypothetical protein
VSLCRLGCCSGLRRVGGEMSEVEQLRKEVNELRERIAKLEATRAPMTGTWAPHGVPQWPQPQPTWISDVAQHFPPGTVLC